MVVFHPIKKMAGDFLTKPLNVSSFKKHINAIMELDEKSIEYYKVKYENEKAMKRKLIIS